MLNDMRHITSPLTPETIAELKVGDPVLLSGVIYTARDAAHKKLTEMLERGEELPFDLRGQTIYYVGPCPAKPGQVLGSAGPTTSKRMDLYTPRLIDNGLVGIIGKGPRNAKVVDALVRNKCVYFAAIGGAGALISKSIVKAEAIAFADLGAEAIYRLEVKDMICVVAIDSEGGNRYLIGKQKYSKK